MLSRAKSKHLAINGGKPEVSGQLSPYRSVRPKDLHAAVNRLKNIPLSGYLAGVDKGGPIVEDLERRWEDTFRIKHAIAVNSGTSGLVLACMAIAPTGTNFYTTPLTMSATAAAPILAGGSVSFFDVDYHNFCLNPMPTTSHVAITVNLFGYPAPIPGAGFTIEDNAQAIFAKESGKFAGCRGDIGVFSLNVHKHLQCGEGGIIVTDNDDLANEMRHLRNHAEMYGDKRCGHNMRMTEFCASVAIGQLDIAPRIMSEREEIACTIRNTLSKYAHLQPIPIDGYHSHYAVAFTTSHRDTIMAALNAEGVPISKYGPPLNYRNAFPPSELPTSDELWLTLAIYENCAYTPTARQLRQMCKAIDKVFQEVQP